MTDPVRACNKHPFEYQKPNDDQIKRIEQIRMQCYNLSNLIQEIISSSRERSLSLTKLEEVSMWANKAIVFEIKE